jgi:hypothetical protein
MPYHRFKLGQRVAAHAPSLQGGPFTIVRLLPLVGKEPYYQGKGDDGIVRALLESQIREVRQPRVGEIRKRVRSGAEWQDAPGRPRLTLGD